MFLLSLIILDGVAPVFNPAVDITVSVAENAPVSVALHVDDADGANTLTWTVNTHATVFELFDGAPVSFDRTLVLKSGVSLDFETAPNTYAVDVR